MCGLVAIALAVWAWIQPPGWDVAIYHTAIKSLQAGHDPYADAMAVQRIFHSQLAQHPDAEPPYSYVYSPITLPILRLIGHAPTWLSGGVYLLLYLAAILAQLYVTLSAATEEERRYFLYLAPVAAFFPGLLASGILLSGNIAYILYAAVLLTAMLGWRRGEWRWFYLAVLVASCVKAPLLCLVAIAVLSARRQWIPAGLTTAAGLALFAVQPMIWPDLFRHYLQAVELQFSFNRDFGSSPAGLFCDLLYSHGIPYSPGGLIFYLGYAIPLVGTLFYLSRLFLRGCFTLQQWMPVMLVGVVLLNPRLIEYDLAPLALPLAFIGWRSLSAYLRPRRSTVAFALFFLVANAFALTRWTFWKIIEGPLLVIFFVAGSWFLLRSSRADPAEEALSPN